MSRHKLRKALAHNMRPANPANFVAGSFAPTDNANIVNWFAARDTGTWTRNGSNVITAWSDKTANNDDVATISGSPTITDSQINGYPAATFAPSNFLTLTNTFNSNTMTIALVVKPTSFASFNPMIGNTSNPYTMIGSDSTNARFAFTGSTDGATALRNGGTLVVDTWITYIGRKDASSIDLYRNGTLLKATTLNDITTNGIFRIGQDGFGNDFNGQIAEWCIFNEKVSDSFREDLEAYWQGIYEHY